MSRCFALRHRGIAASSCRRRLFSTATSHFTRMSGMLLPTKHDLPSDAVLPGHRMLLRAGFIRQVGSGLYALLPLGLRVQDKLCAIIDEEIAAIGAHKLAMPHLNPAQLWQRSGRWQQYGDEIFKFSDRKSHDVFLAPTHEESFTDFVADSVNGHSQLPLRLYQIGTKFRDELRPRGGLLRGREFLMKDLYTFDKTRQEALETYGEVCDAYQRIFERIEIEPVKVDADAGKIGGDHCHEYHLECADGEDTLLSCEQCGSQSNQENLFPNLSKLPPDNLESAPLVLELISQFLGPSVSLADTSVKVAAFFSPGSKTPTLFFLRGNRTVNTCAVAHLFDSDFSSVDDDRKLHSVLEQCLQRTSDDNRPRIVVDRSVLAQSTSDFKSDGLIVGDFCATEPGDSCQTQDCSGQYRERRGIELAHVFYLGTKYSDKFNARFTDEHNKTHAIEMGCFGIGVSRLLQSIAEVRSDQHGLVWPDSLAPFRAVVIPAGNKKQAKQILPFAENIAHQISETSATIDRHSLLLDDRTNKGFGFRVNDAALIGVPWRVIVGQAYQESGLVELENRVTGDKLKLDVEDLVSVLDAV